MPNGESKSKTAAWEDTPIRDAILPLVGLPGEDRCENQGRKKNEKIYIKKTGSIQVVGGKGKGIR